MPLHPCDPIRYLINGLRIKYSDKPPYNRRIDLHLDLIQLSRNLLGRNNRKVVTHLRRVENSLGRLQPPFFEYGL